MCWSSDWLRREISGETRDDCGVFDEGPGDGAEGLLQEPETLHLWSRDMASMTGEDEAHLEQLAPRILTDLQAAGCKITTRWPPLPESAIGAMVAPRIHIQSSGLTKEHVALTVGVDLESCCRPSWVGRLRLRVPRRS